MTLSLIGSMNFDTIHLNIRYLMLQSIILTKMVFHKEPFELHLILLEVYISWAQILCYQVVPQTFWLILRFLKTELQGEFFENYDTFWIFPFVSNSEQKPYFKIRETSIREPKWYQVEYFFVIFKELNRHIWVCNCHLLLQLEYCVTILN